MGWGTNRVIGLCRAAGIAPPKFQEVTGAAVVTFKVNVRAAQAVAEEVTPQVEAVLRAALQEPKSREKLQMAAQIRDREHFRNA